LQLSGSICLTEEIYENLWQRVFIYNKMQISAQTILLFTLNLLDAVLTIYWVRNGFATEGNRLMAILLDIGDLPFLAAKLAIGAAAALVLWNWRNLRLARCGLSVVLFLYIGLMGVHFVTGLSRSVWSPTISCRI
jgi:hypothetical protein